MLSSINLKSVFQAFFSVWEIFMSALREQNETWNPTVVKMSLFLAD